MALPPSIGILKAQLAAQSVEPPPRLDRLIRALRAEANSWEKIGSALVSLDGQDHARNGERVKMLRDAADQLAAKPRRELTPDYRAGYQAGYEKGKKLR